MCNLHNCEITQNGGSVSAEKNCEDNTIKDYAIYGSWISKQPLSRGK